MSDAPKAWGNCSKANTCELIKEMRWGNCAAAGRNTCAELAHKIVAELEPIVDGERTFTQTELLQRIARALKSAQKQETILQRWGAPVVTDEI